MNQKFRYMLAPLEDMTGPAFRSLCYKFGADLTFTELIRFESLAKSEQSIWQRTIIPDGTPTVIQIVGTKEQFLKKFLEMYKPQKGFMGFNLNLGCPDPALVKNGAGCAMVKRISKTKKLVKIIKDRGYRASIKMRLGLNSFEKERKTYLNLIDAVNADFFIVHARHGKQTYNEKADWSVYPECVKTGKTIIANGDIRTKQDVLLLQSYGVHGVMIGREAVRNPGIFVTLKGVETPSLDELRKEYLKITKEFNEPFRYLKNVSKHLGSEEGFTEEA